MKKGRDPAIAQTSIVNARYFSASYGLTQFATITFALAENQTGCRGRCRIAVDGCPLLKIPNWPLRVAYGTSSSDQAWSIVGVRHRQSDRGESTAPFQRRCHAYRAISDFRVRC